MSLRTRARSRTSWTAEDVLCHYCRQAGNGNSPYRAWASEAEGWPRGVRFIVCSPSCPDLPAGDRVFVK